MGGGGSKPQEADPGVGTTVASLHQGYRDPESETEPHWPAQTGPQRANGPPQDFRRQQGYDNGNAPGRSSLPHQPMSRTPPLSDIEDDVPQHRPPPQPTDSQGSEALTSASALEVRREAMRRKSSRRRRNDNTDQVSGRPPATTPPEGLEWVPVYGELITRSLFSPDWKDREQALQEVLEAIRGDRYPGGYCEPDVAWRITAQILQITLREKVAPLYFLSLDILTNLVAGIATRVPGYTLHEVLDEIMPILIHRVGNKNVRIQEATMQTIISITKDLPSGVSYIGQFILLDTPKKLESRRGAMDSGTEDDTNSAQLTGRLALLLQVLLVFHTSQGMGIDNILKFTQRGLEHPDEKVRGTAVNVVSELYKMMRMAGGKLDVEKYIGPIKPALMQVLMRRFSEIEQELSAPTTPLRGATPEARGPLVRGHSQRRLPPLEKQSTARLIQIAENELRMSQTGQGPDPLLFQSSPPKGWGGPQYDPRQQQGSRQSPMPVPGQRGGTAGRPVQGPTTPPLPPRRMPSFSEFDDSSTGGRSGGAGRSIGMYSGAPPAMVQVGRNGRPGTYEDLMKEINAAEAPWTPPQNGRAGPPPAMPADDDSMLALPMNGERAKAAAKLVRSKSKRTDYSQNRRAGMAGLVGGDSGNFPGGMTRAGGSADQPRRRRFLDEDSGAHLSNWIDDTHY